MTPLERLVAAIKLTDTDRAPVVVPVFGHAAHLCGIRLDRYLCSGDLLAKAQLHAMRHYGYDIVFAFFDANVETETMGSRLCYRNNEYPYVAEYAFSPHIDFTELALPDLSSACRIPELLKAAGRLRHEVGDTTPVAGILLGPFNLVCQLIGMDEALYLVVDHPDAFTRLLDFATEFCIAYGKAQINAGVHLPIIFDVSASSEIIPAAFFREFEMPRLKKVFEAFKAAGSIANWLFITGNITPILPYFPQMGVEIANFDYCVSPTRIKQALPRTCVCGNIKPVLFEYGRPSDIEANVQKLRDAFSDRNGFMLSAGCEIPLQSRPENIKAMVNTIA